jgi:hypothetical protein
MSDTGRNERDRALQLMMAAMDDEIDAAGREELETMLRSDAGLRDEWDRLRRVKEATRKMTLRKPPEEVWDRYWVSVYNRLERGIGWILASVGATILISFGLWKFVEALFEDRSMPGFIRISILLLIVGLVVLLVSVIREKFFTGRRDAYKEVER